MGRVMQMSKVTILYLAFFISNGVSGAGLLDLPENFPGFTSPPLGNQGQMIADTHNSQGVTVNAEVLQALIDQNSKLSQLVQQQDEMIRLLKIRVEDLERVK